MARHDYVQWCSNFVNKIKYIKQTILIILHVYKIKGYNLHDMKIGIPT